MFSRSSSSGGGGSGGSRCIHKAFNIRNLLFFINAVLVVVCVVTIASFSFSSHDQAALIH